jgi:putative oxidoreductase
MAYGILILRLGLGLIVAAHGTQKLFGVLGGRGPHWTAGLLTGLGFRAPLAMAYATGIAELGGGLALAIGLLTPLAAAAIVIVMLNAAAMRRRRNGFANADGGYEFNAILCVASVALGATGGGRFSIDGMLGLADRLSGRSSGLAVLAASAFVSAATLTLGRRFTRDGAAGARQGSADRRGASVSAATESLSRLGTGSLESCRRPRLPHVDGVRPVTPTVEIEVSSVSEGNELIEFLWQHGFTAHLTDAAGRWGVAVESASENSGRVLLDVALVLDAWLRGVARSGLLLHVGERYYAMSSRAAR